MKVPFSWLREFVDVPGTPEDVARMMSVRGFAVESVEPAGDDIVIDFEVTANRPDCMSVEGIAREVATAYALPLRTHTTGTPTATSGPAPLTLKALAPGSATDIRITIDAPDLCSRYIGALADVTIAPSPAWMQARLTAAGVRPISNLVDITNYVLLELGQPMHAFDVTALAGPEIRVRRAEPGERLRTLDGQDRALDAETLVIADAAKAVAVAGVMGGASSEVNTATRTVLFESAHFAPRSVRRTSKQLGLKTEASMRFERGTDPQLPLRALQRACALLEAIGAGRATGTAVDCHAVTIDASMLTLRASRLARVLGTEVSPADVERILTSLGFTLATAPDGWQVSVPTRRVDVTREVDLVEEVARHYGLDRLPVTFPAVTVAPARLDPRVARARQLRAILGGGGFSEAVTFGFISEPSATPFAADAALVRIANPLSETFAVLRPSTLPGLLDAVAHNRRREQHDVRLFEAGSCFTHEGGERRRLGCVWAGAGTVEHWGGGRRTVDFFDIKAVAERLGQAFGIDIGVDASRVPWLVDGRAAAITSNGTALGALGLLARSIAERHGIPAGDDVYVLDLDLDAAESLVPDAAARVRALPKFPSITRDVSILVADAVGAAAIRATIRRAASSALVDVREFDRYQGKGIADGHVSLSYHLTFRSLERTLTDADVQRDMEQVLAALVAHHAAQQR